MNVIVPVGVPHEGLITLATVGSDGALGIAFIVIVEPAAVVQVLSALFLTVNVYTPGTNPLKIGEG